MKVALSHPTGNRNVRAIITALSKEEMLVRFSTTVAANYKVHWVKLLSDKARQKWLRRSYPISSEMIWTHPWREIARMVLPRIGYKNSVHHETGWASVDAVYQNFDQAVAKHLPEMAAKHKISAVYAYEDGALATFTKAKTLGLKCIYDLPIAYWETGRRLMLEEADRLPKWVNTLGGIRDSSAKLERKTRELDLADMVIGPGQFVMDSVPLWAKEKQLVMAPFGSPELSEKKVLQAKERAKRICRPLRVLFVGSMSQRKGLGDLFTAIRLLNHPDIELIIMGSLLAPMNFYRSELPNFTYELGRPHEQVLELMQSCDIFCLPSIVEGRALVMQEAMSQGLPLIITPNTGGADLIKEGHTGFLVPIRSPEVIAEKLNWFIENRFKIPEMARMAQEHAANYTWERYGAQIVKAINNL